MKQGAQNVDPVVARAEEMRARRRLVLVQQVDRERVVGGDPRPDEAQHEEHHHDRQSDGRPAKACTNASRQPHPRVNEPVRQVHEEIHRDVDHRDDEHAALDHRDVPAKNASRNRVPSPGRSKIFSVTTVPESRAPS